MTRSEADIDIHVAELRQIFDVMDPPPLHHRDLDPKAAALSPNQACPSTRGTGRGPTRSSSPTGVGDHHETKVVRRTVGPLFSPAS